MATNSKRSSRKKKRATTKQPQKAISGRKGATAKTQPATHRQAPSKKKSPAKSKPTPSMLSKGGGNATAAGVTFQATIGAIFGAQLLAERALDSRFGLGGAKPKSIRFESEAPLDDIAVETNEGGWLLVQAKNSLSLASSLNSELGKTVEQIVTQWHASSAGSGERGWNRPLDVGRDRLVIAVGAGAAGSVTNDLAKALASTRANHSAPLPAKQREALLTFKALIKAAWKKIIGSTVKAADIDKILPFIAVLRFDIAGPDRGAAVEVMAHVTEHQPDARSAFVALEQACQNLMVGRLGADAAGLRTTLAQAGTRLKAPPSYQADVQSLRTYSDGVAAILADFEAIEIDGARVTVPRDSTDAVVKAAKASSLLVIGDPGAGKSAVINLAAQKLRAEKHDVIQLAVDRLQVDTAEGLRAALDLTHALLRVLDNWPGSEPAFLFIDALDATRGGSGEAVFRTLIAEVMALPTKRWRVIASIRSFDLRLGEQFRELFDGRPADATFFDPNFPDVRHINIPRWSPDELAALLAKAPSLAKAIQTGGDKLHDLALVPFNTRLLADLISRGTAADAFGLIGSQVELLALYWRKRVGGIGASAEVCLRAVVAEMVKGRTLQASKMTGATANAAALDLLLKANVLMPVSGDRYVVFRHHILFDYAASRVFIEPADIQATAALLRSEQDVALMLAPALSFALQELWVSGTSGHPEFWKAAVAFAGDSSADPIARSVASRMACELPRLATDVTGLTAVFDNPAERDTGFKAFAQFVAALHVHAGEKAPIYSEAWCALAATSVGHIEKLAWSLRSLLALLVERTTIATQHAQIGLASRALLTFVLSGSAGTASRLVPSAIEFVCDTYSTDSSASRSLLSLLMKADRLAEHAHEDMPTLARKAKALLGADPEFLITIYRLIYGYKVTDTSRTSMGQSQILPLSSNKKQDYDHGKWELKETLPAFLQTSPEDGTRAVCAALEACVETEQKLDGGEQVFDISGRRTLLLEDTSYAWASDPNDPYAHADNAAGILSAFRKYVEGLDDEAARKLVAFAVGHIRLAVLWSRLFLVAAKRPAALGPLLWPYASARPFLLARDTRKDAIDAVAAIYPQLRRPVRKQFETEIAGVEFTGVENRARTRLRFLATLFGAIGKEHLATAAAKKIVQDASAAKVSSENRRPFQIFTTTGVPDPYWFLKDKDVDLEAPANASVLQLIEALKDKGPPNAGTPATAEESIVPLSALAQALENPTTPAPASAVVDYAEDCLLQACVALARMKDALAGSPAILAALIIIVSHYLKHARPHPGAKAETGPRSHAVDAALRLCGINQATADALLSKVAPLVDDAAAGVRVAFADEFSWLWEYRRTDLWAFATHMARDERQSDVLRSFAHFLCRAVHHDPEKVEALVLDLLPRARDEESPKGDRIIEAIGNLVAVLWLRYERPKARALLDAWLKDPTHHHEELGRVVGSLRDVVVRGYRSRNEDDLHLQKNAQRLAGEVVERTARMLEHYVGLPAGNRTEDDHAAARVAAQLLDHVGDQLYFSSGAFRNNGQAQEAGLVGIETKKAFLDDTFAMLHRIGDVATPHTIYYLIDLLDFLMPSDPPRVFDLVAQALLKGGREWGYEMESLGADRFVKVVGVFLADHRDIFDDAVRRQKLIACLDLFVEVGWPSARRLLYRLPELL